MEILGCIVCGEEFEMHDGYGYDYAYCSSDCMEEAENENPKDSYSTLGLSQWDFVRV